MEDFLDCPLRDIWMSEGRRKSVKWHHYFAAYETHLQRFVGQAPTLVEIGVAGGGSLHMWREYLGQDARIIGVDINPKCRELENDGFEIYIGSQEDPEFLSGLAERLGGQVDILVDDGGHTSQQCILSFEHLYPAVKHMGVYIVEDMQTSIWPQYVDRLDGMTFMDVALGVAEKLTWWHITPNHHRFKQHPSEREGEPKAPWVTKNTWSVTFYNSMAVFEKRVVPEPWNDRR